MKVVLISVIVMVLLAGNLVLAAPDDRFKGGGYDGYDALDFLQTSTNLDLIFARYESNGYDVYENGKAFFTWIWIKERRMLWQKY